MRGSACPDQRAYQIAKSSKSPNAPGGLVNCPLRYAAACPALSSAPGRLRIKLRNSAIEEMSRMVNVNPLIAVDTVFTEAQDKPMRRKDQLNV